MKLVIEIDNIVDAQKILNLLEAKPTIPCTLELEEPLLTPEEALDAKVMSPKGDPVDDPAKLDFMDEEPEPEEDEEPKKSKKTKKAKKNKPITEDDLRIAISEVTEVIDIDAARAVIATFDARKIPDLKKEQYADFIKACKKEVKNAAKT